MPVDESASAEASRDQRLLELERGFRRAGLAILLAGVTLVNVRNGRPAAGIPKLRASRS